MIRRYERVHENVVTTMTDDPVDMFAQMDEMFARLFYRIGPGMHERFSRCSGTVSPSVAGAPRICRRLELPGPVTAPGRSPKSIALVGT